MAQRHSKLPTGAVIHTRQPEQVGAKDIEQEPIPWLIAAQAKLANAVDDIATQAENRAKPVDEYLTEGQPGIAQETVYPLQPTYEYLAEKIESILVNGPPAATATIQLGDRSWPIVMPASGILVIAPIAVLLDRNDPRYLTAASPGNWSFELMGIADSRFNI